MRLSFSMDVGLISPFVIVVNIVGVSGVFGLDEHVNDVRLGFVFGWKRLSSVVVVVGDVDVSWLKYCVIVFCSLLIFVVYCC